MLKICMALRDNTKALLKANLASWVAGHTRGYDESPINLTKGIWLPCVAGVDPVSAGGERQLSGNASGTANEEM